VPDPSKLVTLIAGKRCLLFARDNDEVFMTMPHHYTKAFNCVCSGESEAKELVMDCTQGTVSSKMTTDGYKASCSLCNRDITRLGLGGGQRTSQPPQTGMVM